LIPQFFQNRKLKNSHSCGCFLVDYDESFNSPSLFFTFLRAAFLWKKKKLGKRNRTNKGKLFFKSSFCLLFSFKKKYGLPTFLQKSRGFLFIAKAAAEAGKGFMLIAIHALFS
jgi:hypothetical protein